MEASRLGHQPRLPPNASGMAAIWSHLDARADVQAQPVTHIAWSYDHTLRKAAVKFNIYLYCIWLYMGIILKLSSFPMYSTIYYHIFYFEDDKLGFMTMIFINESSLPLLSISQGKNPTSFLATIVLDKILSPI